MRSRLLPILTLLALTALPVAAHTRALSAPNNTLQQSLSGSLDLEPEIALPVVVTEAADTLPVFTRSQKLASGFFGLGAEPNIQKTLDLGQESRLGDDSMHARYYNPNLGRFLSVDPVLDQNRALSNPQSWNRYMYGSNNPVNRVDPDGRVDFEAMWAQLKSMIPSAEHPIVLDPVNRPLETAANMVVIATLISPFPDEAAGAATRVIVEDSVTASRGASRTALREAIPDLKRSPASRRPAVAIGATNPEAGMTAVGKSKPGRTGCCAEVDAARQVGGDPKKVIFSEPVRPRTGETIPVCTNCQKKFDASQFPPGTPMEPR